MLFYAICLSVCASALAWNPYSNWDPSICCYPVPPGCCDEPCPQCLDVAWIVDESSSITSTQEGLMKDFMKDFANHFTIGANAFSTAAVMFATNARLVWNFGANADTTAEVMAIDGIMFQGGLTNVITGMQLVIADVIGSAGDRPDCDNICIVVTDGLSQVTDPLLDLASQDLHAACDRVYAVGVELFVDPSMLADFEAQLLTIAGGDAARKFTTADFEGLRDVVQELLDQICADFAPESSDECCPYDFIYMVNKGFF